METIHNKVDRRRKETQKLYKAWINKEVAALFDEDLKAKGYQFKSWLQDQMIKELSRKNVKNNDENVKK